MQLTRSVRIQLLSNKTPLVDMFYKRMFSFYIDSRRGNIADLALLFMKMCYTIKRYPWRVVNLSIRYEGNIDDNKIHLRWFSAELL